MTSRVAKETGEGETGKDTWGLAVKRELRLGKFELTDHGCA